MRLGILGGTFNPVHLAHLQMARDAMEQCGLERVLFMPAATPPHKPLAGELSFEHRFAMVELAIENEPRFDACDLEGRRGGKSYSVESLETLGRMYPSDELFFLMGMDSFAEIHLWRRYPRLFELAHLVVLMRPGTEFEDPLSAAPVAMRGEFCYPPAPKGLKTLKHSSGNRVFFIEETLLDISSTRIRERVSAGLPIDHLVPAAVSEYITRHGFYRPTER